MKPSPYDLFGEVALTWDEVFEWVEINAPRWHNSHRINWYIKNWNVIEKAQRDKVIQSSI
jgi:hypothetical protein